MILAIPTQNDVMTEWIFMSDAYSFVDVDPKTRAILATRSHVAPPIAIDHLPDWLVKMGATVVIAHGMNKRLRSLCEYHGLKVVLGVDPAPPEQLAKAFVTGSLHAA